MSVTQPQDLPRNPWWLRRPDLLARTAVAVTAVAAVVELVRVSVAGGGLLPAVGVVTTLAGAVLARRSWWVGLATALVGCAVTAVNGWDPITEWTMVVFTLFAATLTGAPPVRSTLLVVVPLYVIVAVEAGSGLVSADVLASVAATIAGSAAGAGLRSQHQYWAALRTHAKTAIATRESEAQRRVEQERLRIARDLHDVVGHQVAVASMHLGAVEVTIGRDPDAAVQAAAQARTALRTVTAETQQILELLRNRETDQQPDQHVAGIASIGALVDSFRSIGLQITAALPDCWPAMHPGSELTIYRILQEALTNAHRYGDGTATVTVRATGHIVDVAITNASGTDASHAGSGFGLLGMRERVSTAGGRLQISDTGNLFTVHAELAVDGRKLS